MVKEEIPSKAIAISGSAGAGKSSIVTNARQALAEENIVWLFGQCSKYNDAVPFSYFQDVLKTLFALPAFNIDNDNSSQKIETAMKHHLGEEDLNFINTIKNIILPIPNDDNQSILENKQSTFAALGRLLIRISSKTKTVLVVEDIEDIDRSSYECLKFLIENNILDQNIKLIATHSKNFTLDNFFFAPVLGEQNSLNYRIKPFEQQEIISMVMNLLGGKDVLPDNIKTQMIENSKGLPLYLEETMLLLMQTGLLQPEEDRILANPQLDKIKLPETLEQVIQARLESVKNYSQEVFKVICYAALFGPKFMPAILPPLVVIENKSFQECMQMITANGFFVMFDDFNYLFKHKMIWETVLNFSLEEEDKVNYSLNVANFIEGHTRSSSSITASYFDYANIKEKAFEQWKIATQEAISVGDINVYSTTLTRQIQLLSDIEIPDKEQYEAQICEQLGKINNITRPQESIPYLTKALEYYEKEGNNIKTLELCSYLSKSCELNADFLGAIECIDKALSMLDESMVLENALLNFSKLEPLCNLGKFQEVVSVAQKKVLPIVQSAIQESQTIGGLQVEELYQTIVETMLVSSESMALQGNKNGLIEIENIIKQTQNSNMPEMTMTAYLVKALCVTIQGNATVSEEILEKVKPILLQIPNNAESILYWNFISQLNDVIKGKLPNIKEDLSTLINQSQGTGNYNFLVILRTLLAKAFKDEGDIERAKHIYYELINFVSRNKLALPSLLLWYLIAELEKDSGNLEEAESIAQKALDVAQKPEINNFVFASLIQQLIGKINLQKGDVETAKMYTEKALKLAIDQNLFALQCFLYKDLGTITKSSKAFEKGLNIANQLQNKSLQGLFQK